MSGPNLTLITELQTLVRRDFGFTDPTLLQPLNANPVVDGEWLELDGSYKLIRGAPGGTNNEGIQPMVFPLFTERGRYDTQAIGKGTVLMLGMYEAETTILDTTSIVLGSPLTVADVTISSLTKRGLRLEGAVSGRVIVGFASKLFPGSTKVRFVHFGNQKR